MTQRNADDQPEEEILSEAVARAALPPHGAALHSELPPPPPPPFPTLPLPLPPGSNETMSIFVNEDRYILRLFLKFKVLSLERFDVKNTFGESWTSCLLILPPLVSHILFRCLIFNCYNISICKKKNSKMRHLKKFVKPMEVNRFTNFL